jgi:hypothetical protein
VKDHRAQNIGDIRMLRVVERVPDVIQQLESCRRLPAVGTLVVRDLQILFQQFADVDGTNAVFSNC